MKANQIIKNTKLFWAFMLVTAVATSFVSCKKTTTDSDTHTQKFTLGTTEFDINNAFAIENLQDSGLIYNAIVLSQGDYVGVLGSKAKGAIIVFRGDFTPGTHNLVFDPQQPLAHFPMYLIAEHEVDNIINFSLETLMDQADVYVADNGSFTLAMDQDKFTVTTTDVQVKKVFASSGEASVARNGDTYTIDMTGLAIDGISGSSTMHYVGNMPNFDFPFPDE